MAPIGAFFPPLFAAGFVAVAPEVLDGPAVVEAEAFRAASNWLQIMW